MKHLDKWHKIAVIAFLIMAAWSTVSVVFELFTHALVIVPFDIPGLGYFVMIWSDYVLVVLFGIGGELFFAGLVYERAS